MGIPWDGTDKYVPWTTLVFLVTLLAQKPQPEFSVDPPSRSSAWTPPAGVQRGSQPKLLAGPRSLILGEQQYFVWDTASQSTK